MDIKLEELNKDQLRGLLKKSADKILHELADLFHGCDVDGDNLVNLTKDDFKELGLSFGQRKKVLRLIKNPQEIFTGTPTTPTSASTSKSPVSPVPTPSGLLQHKRKREDAGVNGNNKRKKPNQVPNQPPSPMNIQMAPTSPMPTAPPPQMGKQEEEKDPMTQISAGVPPTPPESGNNDARPVWSRIPRQEPGSVAGMPMAPPPHMPVPMMVVSPPPPSAKPDAPPAPQTSTTGEATGEPFVLQTELMTTTEAAEPNPLEEGAEAKMETSPAAPAEPASGEIKTDPKAYGLGEGYVWDEERRHFFNEKTCRVYKPEQVEAGQYWDKEKKIYLKVHPNQYAQIASTYSVEKDATADKTKEQVAQAGKKAAYHPAAAYPAGYTYPGAYTGGYAPATAASYAPAGYGYGNTYQAAAQYENAARASMTTFYDSANLVFPEGGLKTPAGPATIHYDTTPLAPSAELYFQQQEITKQQGHEFEKIRAQENKHKRLLAAAADASKNPHKQPLLPTSTGAPSRPRRRTSRFSSGPARTTGLGAFTSVAKPP